MGGACWWMVGWRVAVVGRSWWNVIFVTCDPFGWNVFLLIPSGGGVGGAGILIPYSRDTNVILGCRGVWAGARFMMSMPCFWSKFAPSRPSRVLVA